MTIGLLHPGEMGAAVGACLTGAGHTVLWASEGRGRDTADRARAAGLRDVGTAAEVSRQASVIFSVCPPHAAVAMARAVAGGPAGEGPGPEAFHGVYVDANAVSPATAREVARIVGAAGASYVDGGIVGSPPVSPGSTRLYLSGTLGGQVAELFAGTAVDARVIGDDAGAASALKMAYAAWTKGTSALILAVRGLARAEGVEEPLLAEWQESQPGLPARSDTAAGQAVRKGWRWRGEMEEIAAAMTAAGLPGGFHQAAADVFARSPRGTSVDEHTLGSVLDALLRVQQPASRPAR